MRVRDASLATVMGLPSMRVAVRVCDHGQQEGSRKRRAPVKIQQQSAYMVDYCFDERMHPHHVYQHLLESTVAEFLQGSSAAVITYGAAQTGKTLALQGPQGAMEWSEGGLIPHALHHICRHMSVVPRHKYKLHFSYSGLTVGHEAQLVDLLNPAAPAISLGSAPAAAALRQLTQRPVTGPDALAQALRGVKLQVGALGPTSASTRHSRAMGLRPGGSSSSSSSSQGGGPLHTLLTVRLLGAPLGGGVGGQQEVVLSFVELAAPEVQGGAAGASARHMALSYASLGKVLAALRSSAPAAFPDASPWGDGAGLPSGQGGAPSPAAAGGGGGGGVHVPWRDCALTRWLQEGLAHARNVLLLGTVSPRPEAAADTLATLSYLARFSSSRPGAGHVITLNWAALTSPAGGAFVAAPAPHLMRVEGPPAALPYAPYPSSSAAAAAGMGSPGGGPGYSSPMVNQMSPVTGGGGGGGWEATSGEAGPGGWDAQDASNGAATAGNSSAQQQLAEVRRAHQQRHPGGGQTQLQKEFQRQLAAIDEETYSAASSRAASPEGHPVTAPGAPQQRPMQQWELPLARTVAASVAAAVGADDAAEALAGPSGQQALHHLQAAHHHASQQRHQMLPQGSPGASGGFPPQQQQQLMAATEDDVLLYGELLEWVRLGGGGLRGESIVEKLLGDLGAARAALGASIGQGAGLRDALLEAQAANDAVHAEKGALQAQVAELTGQLTAVSQSLTDAVGDRDLFLRRLQQLEDEATEAGEGGEGGGGGRLGLQRAKQHAMQLSLLEGELTSLVTSNQGLRSQLEASSTQVSRLAKEKLVVEEAGLEAVQQLQGELAAAERRVEEARGIAASEATQRGELEQQLSEAHAALEALSKELEQTLGAVRGLEAEGAAERATLQQLAEELQETLGAKEVVTGRLEEAGAKVTALEARAAALEHLLEELQQEAAASAAAAEAAASSQQQTQLQLTGLLKLLSQFELDLREALPGPWQRLMSALSSLTQPPPPAGEGGSSSSYNSGSPAKSSRALTAGPSMRPGAAGRVRWQGGGEVSRSAAEGEEEGQGVGGSPDPQQQQQGVAGGGGAPGGVSQLWQWGNELVAARDLMQGVLEVVRVAARGQAAAGEQLAQAGEEVALLEQQAAETQQLVATQENLVQQLQSQLTAATDQETLLGEQLALSRSMQQGMSRRLADAESAHQEAAQKCEVSEAEVLQLQQQVNQLQLEAAEAREAISVLAAELEHTQSTLETTREEAERAAEGQRAQSNAELTERDEALQALAAEVMTVEAARAAAESAIKQLTGDLADLLQQLEHRESVLQGVWAVLKGGTGALPDLGAVWDAPGGTTVNSSTLRSSQGFQYGWHTSSTVSGRPASPFGTRQAQGLHEGEDMGDTDPTVMQQQQEEQWGTTGAARGWAGTDATRVYCLSEASSRGLSMGGQRRAAQALTAASTRFDSSGSAPGQTGKGRDSQQHTGTSGNHNSSSSRGRSGPGGNWEQVLQSMLGQHRRQAAHWSNFDSSSLASTSSSTPVVISAAAEVQQELLSLQQRVHTIPELEAAAAIAGTQVKELSRELGELASQQEQLQHQLQEAEEHAMLLAREVTHLSGELDATRGELDALRGDTSYTNLTTLSGRLAATQAELLRLQAQLEHVQQQQEADALSLAGEKVARMAAEDAELSRAALADQAEALRGRLEVVQSQLGEAKAAAGKLKEELDLMTVSRDTWRDAAKKAEAQVREAATSAQSRALDLTRSRAELLAARDQLTALQSQLDACMAASPALFKPNGPLGEVAGLRELMASGDAEYGELAAAVHGGGEGLVGSGTGSSAQGVYGAALLARLRAAQSLRKEAEARAEALQRSLAAAETQQLHATERGLGSQVLLTEQLAAKSSEAIRARLEAEQARAAAAESERALREVRGQLAGAAAVAEERRRAAEVAERQLGVMALRVQRLEAAPQQQQQQQQQQAAWNGAGTGRVSPVVVARWAGASPTHLAKQQQQQQQQLGQAGGGGAVLQGGVEVGQQQVVVATWPGGGQTAAAAAPTAAGGQGGGGGGMPASRYQQQQHNSSALPSVHQQVPMVDQLTGGSAAAAGGMGGVHYSPVRSPTAQMQHPQGWRQPSSSKEPGGPDAPLVTAAQLLAAAKKVTGSPRSSPSGGVGASRSPGKPQQA